MALRPETLEALAHRYPSDVQDVLNQIDELDPGLGKGARIILDEGNTSMVFAFGGLLKERLGKVVYERAGQGDRTLIESDDTMAEYVFGHADQLWGAYATDEVLMRIV